MAKFYIDGKALIDQNGEFSGAPVEANGSVFLRAGLHPFTVTYMQNADEALLDLTYAGPGLHNKRQTQQ
ncbi:MAG: hypothetical protein GF398_00095 [Chitinivibrionales bacterium]|nr:hypothetical protein [Chitinivibrionales bacterium]